MHDSGGQKSELALPAAKDTGGCEVPIEFRSSAKVVHAFDH